MISFATRSFERAGHPGKDTSGQRLTYLLRPNVTRPDYSAPLSLDTPPATESEVSTFEFASESDFASDTHSEGGVESEIEGVPPKTGGVALSDIAESTPGSPAFPAAPPPYDLDESWSIIGDSDHDGGDEYDLTSSVGSLNVQDADLVTRAQPRIRQTPLRSNVWERHRRSNSNLFT